MLPVEKLKRSNRHRVVLNVPVRIGLKTGTLVDISETGILATHTGTLKTGATVAIEFTMDEQRFVASGRVQSCTVIGLGADADDTGGTIYASRIFFSTLTPDSQQLLLSLLKG